MLTSGARTSRGNMHVRSGAAPLPRRPARAAGRALLVGLLLALPGCYTYVPIQLEAVPTGAAVRSRLAPEGAARIEGLIQSNSRVIEGKLLERDDQQVLLFVPSARETVGYQVQTLHQVLAIPRSHIYDVELRRLDRARTYGLVALAGAALAAVVVRVISGGSENKTDPPGGGGPEEWIGSGRPGVVR